MSKGCFLHELFFLYLYSKIIWDLKCHNHFIMLWRHKYFTRAQSNERRGRTEPHEENVAQSSHDVRGQRATATLGVPILGDGLDENWRRSEFESSDADTLSVQKWVHSISTGRAARILSPQCYVNIIVVPAKIVSFGGLIERPWRTSVKLPCAAVGQPGVKRQWLKSSRVVQSWDGNLQITDNGDVTITSLQRSNSDNYTCHVENVHGADSIIYRITVQGR